MARQDCAVPEFEPGLVACAVVAPISPADCTRAARARLRLGLRSFAARVSGPAPCPRPASAIVVAGAPIAPRSILFHDGLRGSILALRLLRLDSVFVGGASALNASFSFARMRLMIVWGALAVVAAPLTPPVMKLRSTAQE